MSDRKTLHLFEGIGVEIEYMIVDRKTLAVRPIADRVLEKVAGEIVSEIELGELAWSNELVLHVIELKSNGPAQSLEKLLPAFEHDVQRINEILAPLDAGLLPTAMHPLMDPMRETVLWPHEFSPIYEAYNRIFDCRGHGWSNLQSMHLNFPFHGDEELGRLHAAIRLVLPILPALAASSPLVDGRATGHLDTRMEVYRTNSRRIPSLAGQIIPEAVFDRSSYDREIFQPMYRDIAPLDPDGVLRDEFLNSRGAIARFDRGAIEIRVIDTQEAPRADLAIAAAVVAVLRLLVAEHWSSGAAQREARTDDLAAIFRRAVTDGDTATLDDPAYLKLFGLDAERASAAELWRHLVAQARQRGEIAEEHGAALDVILEEGPLARRILRALGPEPSRDAILKTYRRLADCLEQGELFRA